MTDIAHDVLKRVVEEKNQLGQSRHFVYNSGGYLTRRIDRRGLVREFQYDTLGRNTAEIWYDTAADAEMDANRQNTLSFTYDALGRMLSAGDQFAGYAYAYDRLGRMISSDASILGLAPTVTLTNAYDAAGRRTQVAATIGGNADFVTDYAYDQLGRTTSIRQSALHVDADLRDAIPPASEMPDHVPSPASEMPGHVGSPASEMLGHAIPPASEMLGHVGSPASEMPGHVGSPASEMPGDVGQPATLTRYADLAGNQLVAADCVIDPGQHPH